MAPVGLKSIAQALVADGKGIVTADAPLPTLTRRFDALQIDAAPLKELQRTFGFTPASIVTAAKEQRAQGR